MTPRRTPTCGSPSCLVDRLEKTLKEELALSRTFIGQVVTTQVDAVKSGLAGIQGDVKGLKESFSSVENRLVVLETKDKGRSWARGIVGNVLASVLTSLILAVGFYMLFLYNIHGQAK